MHFHAQELFSKFDIGLWLFIVQQIYDAFFKRELSFIYLRKERTLFISGSPQPRFIGIKFIL